MTKVDLAPGTPPVVASAPLDGPTAEGSPSERIVGAALRCVARWGLAKTTLDDVAREARCGRATLYRLFPGGREALWDAVVVTEAHRFFARLGVQARAASGLEDVLVGLVTDAGRALSAHAALRFLVEHEPEAVVSHLAFHRGDRILRTVALEVGPLLEPWLPGEGTEGSVGEAAARVAEWLARLVISYSTSPAADVNLCDPDSVRRLVRHFVLPGLQPASPDSHQSQPEGDHQ